ncbi:hypothetical protein SASPL_141115 [Salvia splendens]|uniref:Cyclin-like domain-containing protein n=1 Tax=Salvia splendens TaxID=180675 RepID=A0A8X8WRW9_SALSN|nr:hypothetical protein SASPL_141115 [Salvia splendens]
MAGLLYGEMRELNVTNSELENGLVEFTKQGKWKDEVCIKYYRFFNLWKCISNLLRVTRITSDLPLPKTPSDDEDPFEPTGFITAFSTWSLEPYPVFAHSSLSFAGHLAELERVLETTSQGTASGPSVVVDNLRAYLQIIDVASILGLDCDISDHAFQLFRDCSSATCLRNRSVEALATAALVQAIREAQEPRTLQEISTAANLPQKEIGKYIKILGEALQLSQPINSNSISVHMPRFCTLLQLNKSAQELATHIGEVVINKCFCTRRNPISISAAAIYLACQLEDKRKTQAEICKVTGLTEVTLRKVYKELLENWDDLLPSNYNPVVPPEKAFPTATISSGRLSSSRGDLVEGTPLEKHTESRHTKPTETVSTEPTTKQCLGHHSGSPRLDTDATAASSSLRHVQFPSPPALAAGVVPWPFRPPPTAAMQFMQLHKGGSDMVDKGFMPPNINDKFN